MKSTVAIITRTKDRPRLLRRAIGSVLGQGFSHWKHVIVNDGGSAPALEALLATYKASYGDRLHVIHHPESRGMQAAANAGVFTSESTYVCLHDDDDCWEPDFLQTCVEFLEDAGPESRYQGVITRTIEVRETIDDDGEPVEQDRRPYLPLSEISLFRMGYENPFPPIAFCYRRSVITEIGPYDPRFSVAGDYDFNFRFLRRYEIGVIGEPLACYHVRVDGSSLGNSVVAGAAEHKKRYNEFKNHYLRGEDPTLAPAVAVGLNAAKYLVELEWLVHEIRQRAEKIEGISEGAAERIPFIESQLSRSLEIQDESFRHLRERAEDPRPLDQLGIIVKELSYLNGIAERLTQRLETIAEHEDTRLGELLERAAISLKDLGYLNSRTDQLFTRAAETAEHQDGRLRELLERTGTTLHDLAYLNRITGQLSARSEELAQHQDRRLAGLLRELHEQRALVTEWRKEKPLLSIGPLRLTWKPVSKRRPSPNASGAE